MNAVQKRAARRATLPQNIARVSRVNGERAASTIHGIHRATSATRKPHTAA